MTLEKLLEGVTEVVPLPKAYLRLRELVHDPDSSLSEITQVISNDPGLTARMLRMVNSAYFGLPDKVDTIGRAVQVLGLNQVHDLALATAAVGSLSKAPCAGMDVYDYWRRSIYAAVMSKIIAKRINLRSAERLFVAGLLHAIGEIILAFKMPDLYKTLRTEATSRQVPLSTLQIEHLGFDYAAISAELMKQWELPPELSAPVLHHTVLLGSAAPEVLADAAVLHVAAIISRAALWRSEADEPVPNFEPVATQLTRLDDNIVEQLMSEADQLVIEAMGLLLPDLKSSKAKPVGTATPA